MNPELIDINLSKPPTTAYSCFVQIVKDEHQRRYPELNFVFSELAKICAEKWRTMSYEDRLRFDEIAKLGQTSSKPDVKEVSLDYSSKPKKRKTLKDPSKPKRALSAFFFFCDVYRPKVRAEHPEWRVSEVAKELGKLWESCTERSKYESQSQADRKRYNEEMQRYNVNNSNAMIMENLINNNDVNTADSDIGYINQEENDRSLSEDIQEICS